MGRNKHADKILLRPVSFIPQSYRFLEQTILEFSCQILLCGQIEFYSRFRFPVISFQILIESMIIAEIYPRNDKLCGEGTESVTSKMLEANRFQMFPKRFFDFRLPHNFIFIENCSEAG